MVRHGARGHWPEGLWEGRRGVGINDAVEVQLVAVVVDDDGNGAGGLQLLRRLVHQVAGLVQVFGHLVERLVLKGDCGGERDSVTTATRTHNETRPEGLGHLVERLVLKGDCGGERDSVTTATRTHNETRPEGLGHLVERLVLKGDCGGGGRGGGGGEGQRYHGDTEDKQWNTYLGTRPSRGAPGPQRGLWGGERDSVTEATRRTHNETRPEGLSHLVQRLVLKGAGLWGGERDSVTTATRRTHNETCVASVRAIPVGWPTNAYLY